MLRPALETAVIVAREGERAAPAVPAPAQLRRYLNFARLPDPALEVARRVLDDDTGFRARVAAAADEGSVGRPGWLFLHRPDGWLEELDQLLQQAAAAEIASKAERHERGAQRRLAGAEAALARAEASARSRADEAASIRVDLDAERSARLELEGRIAALAAEVDGLREERAEIIRRLKAAESSAVQRAAELRSARHELRMVQAELAQVAPDVASSTGDDAEGGGPAEEPGLDRAAVADLVAGAVAAAAELRVAIDSLAELAGLAPGAAASPAASEAPVVAATPRRVPIGLPPAVFDDSNEAAEHLIRTPRLLVLVDGYNISHAQWHGMAPVEQRRRLLDACGELHARTRVEIEIVFDGAGEHTGAGSLVRSDVRFQFTPSDVEADDVILARIDDEPLDRPVLVVSSDRRVRDGAAERGANLLGARQFLHLLRRSDP